MFGPSKKDLQAQIEALSDRVSTLEGDNAALQNKCANLQTWINLDMADRGMEVYLEPAKPVRVIPAEPARWVIRKIEQPKDEPKRDERGRFAAK